MPKAPRIVYRTRTKTVTKYRNKLSDRTIGGRVGNVTAKGIDKTIKGVKNAAKSVGQTYRETGSDIASGARAAGSAIKNTAMKVDKAMSKNKNSGYKQLGAGTLGAVGAIGGYAAGSAWSEHKRKQRGY